MTVVTSTSNATSTNAAESTPRALTTPTLIVRHWNAELRRQVAAVRRERKAQLAADLLTIAHNHFASVEVGTTDSTLTVALAQNTRRAEESALLEAAIASTTEAVNAEMHEALARLRHTYANTVE